MKAIGYYQPGPISADHSLVEVEIPQSQPGTHDLLVEVKAVSVNPVDTKVRIGVAPQSGEIKILGWDATGIVHAVGSEVSLFKPGDRVWYAGDISRQGSNSEFHLVDERIVGRMPTSLDFAQAAAMPLTTITAWEMLFDRLVLAQSKKLTGETLLIIGAAGGVGSIMIQLARQLTGVTIIATASRPETQSWVRELGAHLVIDHSQPLTEELKHAGVSQVTHVVSLTQTDRHFGQIVEVIAPQGKFGLIDDPKQIDITMLKRKSVSLHWELMFTRSLFKTPDISEQHRLLARVASMVDEGLIRTTLDAHFGVINAVNMKRAHALLESGQARGKIVLEGF